MVLISRNPPAKTGRHYVPTNDFELTEEEKRPTPRREPAPVLMQTQPPAPAKPVHPPPSRIVVVKAAPPRARKASAPKPPKPVSAPPPPLAGRVVMKPISDRALQDSIIEGLELRRHLIRPHIFDEVEQVVRGERQEISDSLLDVERRICVILRVPGF